MLKFQINEYLELRLEHSKTNIYVNNELFIQCKYLLLNLPLNEMEGLEVIDSIDDAVAKLNRKLDQLICVPNNLMQKNQCFL